MRTSRTISTLLLYLVLLGCATTEQQITQEQVSQPESWGKSTQVTQLRHLFFSNQPDTEALVEAKERGIGVVINLRAPSESDWDEESAAKGLSLAYFNVPVSGTAPFSPAAINQIDALVKLHSDKKILMHCSSGNRAAGWLAIHLASQHGMETAEAMQVANKAGITKEGIRDKVRQYIADHIPAP